MFAEISGGDGRSTFPRVVIGLAGIALVAAAYPLYRYMLKKEREGIAPEILRLADINSDTVKAQAANIPQFPCLEFGGVCCSTNSGCLTLRSL